MNDTSASDDDEHDHEAATAGDGRHNRAPRFTASFDITYDDYLALCDAQDLWKPSKIRLPRPAHWALTALIAVGGLVLVAVGDGWFGGVLLVGVAVILLMEFALIPVVRKRSYTKQGLEGMTVTLKADDDGFNMTNAKADSRIAWGAVKRINRFREHLILWTSRQTGLVLPERAFASKAEADAFYDFAMEKTPAESS